MRELANRDGRVDLSTVARRPRDWKRELAAAAAVGAFLGVIGPFGSYFSAPVGQRVAYWTGSALLGTFLFGTAVRVITNRGLPPSQALPIVLTVVALLSVPFALVVALPAHALWPSTAQIPTLHWYLQVLAVSAPMCVAWTLLVDRADRRASSRAELQRQPEPLGVETSAVLCLQMEDHYVRVHHSTGSTLVLTTMRRAQQTLHRVPGLQVHRSWWVADKAVAEVLLEGRSLRLRLTNGLLVPVSRSGVATVRAAGWLDGHTSH